MPQISVIVPVYKVEKYIERCVDSILAQSFADFELILVDDGSPDGCGKICDEYAKKDQRVHVIHKENGGLSDARNAGIDWMLAHSDSPWLCFIDSDDYVHPDYLKILLNAAEEKGADLAICDFVRVNDSEEEIHEEYSFTELVTEDKNELFNYLYGNWRIRPAWNKLYSREIFADLRFEYGKIHEDEFAIHHVLWGCRRAVIIKDGLYYYRTREGSIMADESPRSLLDRLEAFIEQCEFCNERGLPVCDYLVGNEYLRSVIDMRESMDEQSMPRYKALLKRYRVLYFGEEKNKNLKCRLEFNCNRLFRALKVQKYGKEAQA